MRKIVSRTLRGLRARHVWVRHSSSDLVLMINYIFWGATAPQPYKEVTDFNYDYWINSSDIIEMVSYIFRGGRPIQ